MRFWGILLVLMLTACTPPPPRYEGAEPTTPAVEPPAQGALYGRVMHATGTAAPRAAVGVRQWTLGDLYGLVVTAGLSCAFGACAEPKYVKQTPEGTYSFPPEMVKERQLSVVAEWGDKGVSAEVFFKNEDDPQRVPDLLLWEPELKQRRIGDDVLVSWPRFEPGAVYTLYSKRDGQISAPTLGTSRLVPGWRVDGELFVEARTAAKSVKYVHRTARFPAPAGRGHLASRTTLAGRDCVDTQGHSRVVLRSGDLETSDDGVTFRKITVPQPKWGVRTTTVAAKYVCGREVDVW
ncbi:MAG: hypothetical protein QOF58_3693 [Pseudonocardiales bacterium]|jgi:hypothetical protein|nr:hypothetical protein [Pseudonocardiales bacterium]